MAAKQSTEKIKNTTDESQGQEEEQPKEQIKRPAKSGSSSTSSQKSSEQNEKTDDEGESDEVNNTTSTANKKKTSQSKQKQEETTEEENSGDDTGQQEDSGDESLPSIKSDMFETVRSFFEETMNSPVRVTAIMDAEDGWNIEVELVEEKEYTQRYGRDQLIGIYEATMNKDQKITSYQRMNTRPRSTPFEKKER